MILGTGVDLVEVPGFAAQLAEPGTRFASVFTASERRDATARADASASLAARWAAKEAFIKAWSESLWGQPPVTGENIHHLIEVVTDAWDRPRLKLHGEVASACAGLAVRVSLSHDGDFALAQVVLSSAQV